jgi:hypothetical protein
MSASKALKNRESPKAAGLRYPFFKGVHALKPHAYSPPDTLWEKLGFQKDQERLAYYHWQDVTENSETQKPMHVWVKHLQQPAFVR